MDIPQDAIADLTRRLRRIEGQVRGVQQMVADHRDCRDLVTQITAARKALDQVGFLLIANGLSWCATHPDEAAADGDSIAEFERMFLKLS
ncbi:MAG: metal-sensitive transcriptional regulator [Acidimicrobiia bacterium]